MKIYGICVAKNEEDIIAECLINATAFCDQIFVIDNGSNDATWGIVHNLAKEYSQIVPFLRTEEPFRDGIRSLVYNQYYQELTAQDWWFRLDADEFLSDNPRSALQQANQEKADFIQAWQAQFYFTDVDFRNWLAGNENLSKSIKERRRYYAVNWREYRFFRNQPNQAWKEAKAPQWPEGLKKVASERIVNLHYQDRDPEQIQKRLKQRYGHTQFRHITTAAEDWKTKIRSVNSLDHYQPGQPLKIRRFKFYLQRIRKKILKWIQECFIQTVRISTFKKCKSSSLY